MRFYVASKLENATRVRALRDRLVALGHEPTYDWTAHGSVQDQGEERIREVAIAEMMGVLLADVVIVLFPGGRGTHTELGAALAHAVLNGRGGKRVVLIGDPPIEDGRTCAFYHHPLVVRVASEDEFIDQRTALLAVYDDHIEALDAVKRWVTD